MLMLLVAVVALPTMAYAATTASQLPAPGTTVRSAKTVSCDVLSATKIKSAKVNGVTAAVIQSTVAGKWSFSQVESPVGSGFYKGTWTWAPVGGSGGVASIVAPFTPVVGSNTVTVVMTDVNGAVTTDSWAFTYALPVVPPIPPALWHATYDNAKCDSCHGSKNYDTDNAMGPKCVSCHRDGFVPAHGMPQYAGAPAGTPAWVEPSPADVAAGHKNLSTYILTSSSAACAACHGTDVLNVGPDPLKFPHIQGEHQGCSCHDYGEANSLKGCADCHEDQYAPHGFVDGISHTGSGWIPAGGHNTTLYGVNGAASEFGEGHIVIKSDKGTTIEQEWPLPTASVFWSQSNLGSLSPTDAPAVAMAPALRGTDKDGGSLADNIRTDVGWNTVVSCVDCHSGLTAAGPQGANTLNAGLDPNFPDDWTKAEITSFDPTGMRKIDTVRDTPNPFYPKLGSNVYMPAEVENATDPHNPWAGMSIETTTKAAIAGTTDTSITVYPGGFYGLTSTPSNGYSMGNSTGRFLCQKCHKLTNSYQGLGIEGNGRGARDNNLNYMGMSNEAHMEHHNDMVTGQGNCVSCHIAIPHGWKRPRLLVYESDPAPYKVQYVWPSYRATDTAVLRNMNPTDLYTAGNWGFLSNPTATTSNRYQDLNSVNAFTGAVTSSHLEKLDASTSALKELAVGPAEEFKSYDASNSASFSAFTGIDVKWNKWQMAAEGVEWHGNTNGYSIPATFWDGATNQPVAGTEYPIQNQCNACTSASSGTHAPQVGTNTGGEGVKPELPAWK